MVLWKARPLDTIVLRVFSAIEFSMMDSLNDDESREYWVEQKLSESDQ